MCVCVCVCVRVQLRPAALNEAGIQADVTDVVSVQQPGEESL